MGGWGTGEGGGGVVGKEREERSSIATCIGLLDRVLWVWAWTGGIELMSACVCTYVSTYLPRFTPEGGEGRGTSK